MIERFYEGIEKAINDKEFRKLMLWCFVAIVFVQALAWYYPGPDQTELYKRGGWMALAFFCLCFTCIKQSKIIASVGILWSATWPFMLLVDYYSAVNRALMVVSLWQFGFILAAFGLLEKRYSLFGKSGVPEIVMSWMCITAALTLIMFPIVVHGIYVEAGVVIVELAPFMSILVVLSYVVYDEGGIVINKTVNNG